MSEQRCVVLFVKFPEKGKVKSRLAQDLEGDFVLLLYRSMVLDAIDMLKKSHFPFCICFDPPGSGEHVQQWLGPEYAYMPQTGVDIGERMERAFVRLFSEGMQEVLLIGSDIPALTVDVIGEAFHSLAKFDAVVGPANDGGYYLVGFTKNAFLPFIFHDVKWSTGRVFEETIERLRGAKRSIHILPACIDADTKEDLKAILDLGEGQAVAGAPRTMALLKSREKSIRE